ncbi:hypothetical protein [Legionella maioricensis]|uniref:Uncharacterized protein n=1 Tax=Legionella maioricensis TaxID=2896528 RepID=A0A9X2ID37_9GAMM|nr:hypothetical protein [Legionella maioricensis]MCL9684368.1 hypothetical protein [Legionella maioricensis]MCL9687549.1 hypothetical protein [Legionella maioricensis]
MLKRWLTGVPPLRRSTFFSRQSQQTHQRSHHHSSQNNSIPRHELKTHFPIFTFLEMGLYGCTLFYLVYSIKNEKVKLSNNQTPNLNEAPRETQEPKGPRV